MSDESKQNIDELLSGYVDGELSQRNYTELKRLMGHDPKLAEKFEELKKQKQLLNAMPVESAPEGLLDAVIATQERKFILNEYSAATVESEGIKHLMLRRALTAAVILVLFGGLVGLIVNIIMPSTIPDTPNVASGNLNHGTEFVDSGTKVPDKKSPVTVDTPIFRASLNIKTEQAIAMNSFIMKAIFTRDLNDYVDPPENEGTSSTIRIACGIDSVVGLLEDLQGEWDKCKQANLSVYDHALAREIVIKNVSSPQLMSIFKEDKFYTRMQLAKDHSDFNELNPHGGRRIASTDAGTDTEVPKPELTSSGSDKKPRLDGGEKISLVITVTGL